MKLGHQHNCHKGRAALRIYELCVSIPIVYLPWVNAYLAHCLKSVLNVKALIVAFNQEKALVGALLKPMDRLQLWGLKAVSCCCAGCGVVYGVWGHGAHVAVYSCTHLS